MHVTERQGCGVVEALKLQRHQMLKTTTITIYSGSDGEEAPRMAAPGSQSQGANICKISCDRECHAQNNQCLGDSRGHSLYPQTPPASSSQQDVTVLFSEGISSSSRDSYKAKPRADAWIKSLGKKPGAVASSICPEQRPRVCASNIHLD